MKKQQTDNLSPKIDLLTFPGTAGARYGMKFDLANSESLFDQRYLFSPHFFV
jgi:hypothetical protein